MHFDWKGLLFTLQAGGLCLLVGFGGHYGLSYASTRHVSPQQPPIQVETNFTPSSDAHAPFAPRTIPVASITDTVPATGKFIAADLVDMRVYLYQDGVLAAEYPILTKGRPGTAWDTPSGLYTIRTKEENHFSSIGKVYMPYSMQFYGNYFIHGETYYPDGTPTAPGFSGGCIRLKTADAQNVFAFADVGTDVFVYDASPNDVPATLTLDTMAIPDVTATAYLVADLDTRDVYAEQNAQEVRPIASITTLMTALVANETISFDKKISVPRHSLDDTTGTSTPSLGEKDDSEKVFVIGDLLYPLLMQSSDGVADSLARYYGSAAFVRWMNVTAHALNMRTTTFADSSGMSPENISTSEDLFRLTSYLSRKKSFVLDITHTSNKTIVADDGSRYDIVNVNDPADADPFMGGKAGHNTDARDTMVSVISFDANGETRRAVVVVLDSTDRVQDTKRLAQWITETAQKGTPTGASACASCAATIPKYRVIEL